MLNWLAGSDPAFISSIGGVKTLAPDPSRPERCADCDITADWELGSGCKNQK